MNIEHRTSNVEVGLLRVIIRGFNLILFSFLLFSLSKGQVLQPIYSGLDNATSLYVTQNSIYVVEQGKNRLLKLDHSGKLIETMGGKGSGNYQFSKPMDVDATNGLKVFVTDYNNRRVQVFDKRGQYLSSISASDAFGSNRPYNPTQIAVNGLGEVFFVDEAENYILRFDLDSNLLDEFRIPSEVKSVDEMGITFDEIQILDKKSETIHRLSISGGYFGFYPAEGVHSISSSTSVRSGIWMLYEERALLESRSGSVQIVIDFMEQIKAVDSHAHDDFLYILTRSGLYKTSISE